MPITLLFTCNCAPCSIRDRLSHWNGTNLTRHQRLPGWRRPIKTNTEEQTLNGRLSLPHPSHYKLASNSGPCVSTPHTLICHSCLFLRGLLEPDLDDTLPLHSTPIAFIHTHCAGIWFIHTLLQVSSDRDAWKSYINLALISWHCYNLAGRLRIPSLVLSTGCRHHRITEAKRQISDLRSESKTIHPRHAWAGCITDWLLCCWGATVRLGGINAQMQTLQPFTPATMELYSLVAPYPSWHWGCVQSTSLNSITRISQLFTLCLSALPSFSPPLFAARLSCPCWCDVSSCLNSASTESGCSSQSSKTLVFHKRGRCWGRSEACKAKLHSHGKDLTFIYSEGMDKQRTHTQRIFLPSNSKAFVNKACL